MSEQHTEQEMALLALAVERFQKKKKEMERNMWMEQEKAQLGHIIEDLALDGEDSPDSLLEVQHQNKEEEDIEDSQVLEEPEKPQVQEKEVEAQEKPQVKIQEKLQEKEKVKAKTQEKPQVQEKEKPQTKDKGTQTKPKQATKTPKHQKFVLLEKRKDAETPCAPVPKIIKLDNGVNLLPSLSIFLCEGCQFDLRNRSVYSMPNGKQLVQFEICRECVKANTTTACLTHNV